MKKVTWKEPRNEVEISKQHTGFRSRNTEWTQWDNTKKHLPGNVINFVGHSKLPGNHKKEKAYESHNHEWGQCEAGTVIELDYKNTGSEMESSLPK